MTHEQYMNAGEKPDVVIEQASGSLRLLGWERPEVYAKAEGDLSMRQDDGQVTRLRCEGDAVVRVPHNATLTVEQSQGDLQIKAVQGRIQVDNAAGELSLRHSGEARIGTVAGDASLKHIGGALHIDNIGGDLSLLDARDVEFDNVGGDVSIRGANGSLSAGNVGGDLFIEGVNGRTSIGNLGGDLRAVGVQGEFSAGNIGGDVSTGGAPGPLAFEKIGGDLNAQGILGIQADVGGDAKLSFASTNVPASVSAGGDIVCRFPPEAAATVHITSANNNIAVNTPGAGRSIEAGSYELKLGGGETPITLAAGGDATVLTNAAPGENGHGRPRADFDFDFDFDRDFGAFGSGWSAYGERIAQRAREAAGRAAAKVQAKVQAKVEQAARRAEAQARRAERRAQSMMDRRMNVEGVWHAGHPFSVPQPPEPPREPVSDEERMTILRMLEQKKITAAQAEQLLAALSGKGA